MSGEPFQFPTEESPETVNSPAAPSLAPSISVDPLAERNNWVRQAMGYVIFGGLFITAGAYVAGVGLLTIFVLPVTALVLYGLRQWQKAEQRRAIDLYERRVHIDTRVVTLPVTTTHEQRMATIASREAVEEARIEKEREIALAQIASTEKIKMAELEYAVIKMNAEWVIEKERINLLAPERSMEITAKLRVEAMKLMEFVTRMMQADPGLVATLESVKAWVADVQDGTEQLYTKLSDPTIMNDPVRYDAQRTQLAAMTALFQSALESALRARGVRPPKDGERGPTL